MTETADVVVVGLGAVGAATLHRLALRGVKAMGIDRFDPPHSHGSTHGETRITRLAVAEGPEYVPLVRRSHAIWRELEAETGETLLNQVGCLTIGEGDGSTSHGKPGFLRHAIEIAENHGIPHELLDSGEIRRRFPQFLVRDEERGFFEPSAGITFPERAVALQLRLARALGATVRTNERVLAVESMGSHVVVTTDRRRVEAARVVLAAGAWLPGLAGGVLRRAASVQRQTLMWFDAENPARYDAAHCPVFIWMHGTGTEDYLYGFPILPGTTGVKVGTERYGPGIDPDQVDRDIPEAEWRGHYARHVEGRLAGVADRLLRATTCLYTVTDDAGFVIDNDAGVITASACSGHGFKHSPALGEHLATLATDGGQSHPAFQPSRFALV